MLYFVLFLVIGWWVAIFIVSCVQCRPYSYFWNQYVDPTAHGTCINISAFFIGNGAASVVTDFLILITPVPIVWSLQMPVSKRLSILGIFALGGLCVLSLTTCCLLANFAPVLVFALLELFVSRCSKRCSGQKTSLGICPKLSSGHLSSLILESFALACQLSTLFFADASQNYFLEAVSHQVHNVMLQALRSFDPKAAIFMLSTTVVSN